MYPLFSQNSSITWLQYDCSFIHRNLRDADGPTTGFRAASLLFMKLSLNKLRARKSRRLFDRFRIRTHAGIEHKLFDRLKHDDIGSGDDLSFPMRSPVESVVSPRE